MVDGGARAIARDECTEDTIFRGRVRFTQPRLGYRAPIDGLLLAGFARRTEGVAVDLCAGAGLVSLALRAFRRADRVVAVERDAELARILEQNAHANRWSDSVQVLAARVNDARHALRASAALVVSNPPYYPDDAVTLSASPRARAARSSARDEALHEVLRGAREMLARRGHVCVVFPAQRLETLLRATSRVGLYARRARLVHPSARRPASRVLLECSPGREGGLAFEWPLVLHEDDGSPTAALRAITDGALLARENVRER